MRDDIQPSTKHIPLRIALFVLALAVAVSSISYGVTRIGRQNIGYSAVDPDTDEEAPRYAVGVVLTYYFEGSPNSMREEKNLLRTAYGSALRSAYKQLDAVNCYEGVTNLASLNRNRGQTLEVSAELYAVLRDAYEKTLERRSYSVFAGALYAEWNSILPLEEPEDFDPLRNEDEARRLEQIAAANAELSAFSLEFLDDERHLLRFSVSNAYQTMLQELEIDAPVLDLNLLREAYELELVARALEAEGYTRGYLSTDSGLTLALSGQDSGRFALYGEIEGKPVCAAEIAVTPGSACSMFHSFAFAEDEACFYVLDGHKRHPYVPADGRYRELLASSCVCNAEGALVEACYRNILLQSCADAAQLERTAAEGGMLAAWTLQGDGEKIVYTVGSGEIEAASDYGFSLSAIS